MSRIAQTQIRLFQDFLDEECDADSISEGLSLVLEELDFICEDWVKSNPDRRMAILSDPSYSKNFVVRWATQTEEPLSEDVIDSIADGFADLVQRFLDYEERREYVSAAEVTNETENDSTLDVEYLQDELNAVYLDYCDEFVSYLEDLSAPRGFSLADLVLFAMSKSYLEEKVDAIHNKLASRLVQLMFQDASKENRPHSLSDAEIEVKRLLDDFHDSRATAISGHMRRIQSAKELLEDMQHGRSSLKQHENKPSDDDDDDDEENEESYSNTCKSMMSALFYVSQPKLITRAEVEAFLEKPTFLKEKAHAIRNGDFRVFAQLLSDHYQETCDLFPPRLDLLERDIKSMLNDYREFMDLGPSVSTLPSTSMLLGGGGGGMPSSSYASTDLARYRAGHPELKDADPPVSQNIDFYRGSIQHPSYKCFIDDFHDVERYQGDAAATTKTSTWFGCYTRLEAEHSYIQHLFPIQEGQGLSYNSQRLQKHEIVVMQKDPAIRERLLRSLETMMDFYGFSLNRKNPDVPSLTRNEDNYEEQFDNLNLYSHNYLRITRILKCLGDLGFVRLQEAIVDAFIRECFEWSLWEDREDDNEECLLKNLRGSLENYWVETIRNDELRTEYVQRIARGKDRLKSSSKKVLAPVHRDA